MTVYFTTSDVMAMTHKTRRTVQNWVHQEGLPLKSPNSRNEATIDSLDFLRWWADRAVGQRVKVGDGGEVYDRNMEEARLKHHQANLEELKEAEKRQELIPVDDAINEYSQLVSNARAKILQLDQFVPTEHKEKLRAAINKALDELSDPEVEI